MGRIIKLKGSTLIEGIVAMVIILTCATIAFTALSKQKKSINSAIRVQAEANIAFVVAEAKNTGKLLDNSIEFENMRVELQIIGYLNYKNLRILSCEAFNKQNELLGEYKEVINMGLK